MDYQKIINEYYPDEDSLRQLLLKHSRQVADRCLLILSRKPELALNGTFVEEAAMLHDIGIRWCYAPSIFCTGTEPYIKHGQIGGKLLRSLGFEAHARICERHTGTGLPGFEPESMEEKLVCYADKFYSKSHADRELSIEQAAHSLEKFGHEGVEKFLQWSKMFGEMR